MNVTTVDSSSTQPQSRTKRPAWPSSKPAAHLDDDDDDPETTPRQFHHDIGTKPSSETLRAKKSAELLSAELLSATSTTSTSPSSTSSDNTAVSSNGQPETKIIITEAPSASSRKFSLRNKKKHQERLEQEREEKRLKEQANEALRRKHGEYHPPGHGQDHIHTHRSEPDHDRHLLERSRSRSTNNLRMHHPQQGSSSRIRVVSPEPGSLTSPSPTPSSSSARSSRQKKPKSILRGRTTSPKREPVLRSIVKKQAGPQSSDLKDLEANMLSENWNSSSEEEDAPRERKRNSRRKDHSRTESVDTDSSCRTNNSSVVRFDLPPRELRMTCQPSGSDISSSGSEYEPEESQEHSDDSQDKEVQQVGRLAHPSWPHKNKSTTGIVTGLSPEIEGSMSRPHSSTGRYQRDPIVERYLHHNKSGSLALPSTGPSHRPHQRYYSYDKGRQTTEDLSHGAMEELRSKSGSRAESRPGSRPGSRAGGTIRGSTTVGGSVDASSVYGDHEPTTADEHNYLAPLPPFQQGPAYSKVPKRKFCKFCFGGCRWWTLLLWILIPAGILGAIVAYLLHRLLICVAVDPNTVGPIIYAIDPASIQSLSLEYKTQTKGIINIIDSPNATETRVLLKLQRQFYKMKNRQDVTGFQIDTLANGTVRYVLNDVANNERVFYISSVLCSDSILTIEMPRTAPGGPELALDALVDQQDVNINLDETVIRNTSWRFRGLSNRSLMVQALNINALSISYTSTSPSTLTLASVIVRDRLSVVSVHGDIQAAVGFSSGSAASSFPFDASLSPATVNLNTLDGQIQLDMNAWNQSCNFQVNSPSVELVKGGQVVLPFGQQGGPNNILNVTGLTANTGSNSVSGTYTPPSAAAPPPPPSIADPSSVPGIPTASVVLSPTPTATTTTKEDKKKSTVTALGGPVPSGVSSRSDLGAGGSSVPAQFMLQANKNVVIRFP